MFDPIRTVFLQLPPLAGSIRLARERQGALTAAARVKWRETIRVGINREGPIESSFFDTQRGLDKVVFLFSISRPKMKKKKYRTILIKRKKLL